MPRQSTIAARRIRPPHRPWRAIRFRPCRQRAPRGRAVQHRAPVSAPSSARCGPARPCTPRSPLSTVPATGTFPIPIGRERRTFLPRWSYAGCSLVGTPQSGSAPGLSNTPGGISLRRRTVVFDLAAGRCPRWGTPDNPSDAPRTGRTVDVYGTRRAAASCLGDKSGGPRDK